MDVIARSAFGLELNSLHDKTNPFVKNANKFFRVLSIMNPVALILRKYMQFWKFKVTTVASIEKYHVICSIHA